MRKGLFDRLEDILKQAQQENRSNPKEKNASTSVFETILEKAKDVFSDDDDETEVKRKIKDKVDEAQRESGSDEPKSVYERVKELILDDDKEITKTSNSKNNRRRVNKNEEIEIPNVELAYFDELTDEHKKDFMKLRNRLERKIEKSIEQNKREVERLIERNKREIEREIEKKTREEEQLIEQLLRKQERDE